MRREWDDFDPYFDHLILLSLDPGIADPLDRVVGAYRLMRDAVARAGRSFYGACQYDLAPIAELGGPRSSSGARAWRQTIAAVRRCICSGTGRELRAGTAVELLFGVASFHGTDPASIAEALAFLHHEHLAPPDFRVRARPAYYLDMDLMPRAAIEPTRALQAIPSLIKAYLRLGGFVGDGAFIEADFNTIDVCVVMDTGRMKERYLDFYQRTRGRK